MIKIQDALSYSQKTLRLIAGPNARITSVRRSDQVDGGWDVYFTVVGTLQVFTVWREPTGEIYGEW